MDVILGLADHYVLDNLYAKLLPAHPFLPVPLPSNTSLPTLSLSPTLSPPSPPLPLTSAWPPNALPRQILSLVILTMLGIHILYFLFASLSYFLIFDHRLKRHPRYLPNQVYREIRASVSSFPGMLALMLPLFLLEVRGYSKLYTRVDEYGWPYLFASVPIFLLFTDYCIYWIHRWLHLPMFYKHIHKPHHRWIVPTPFASHAFHPIDGYMQGLPYHLFIFILPLQRHLYLALFVFVNCWTILIHDGDMLTSHPLLTYINGPAHHTLHHLYFVCNYGQYFTWADKVGGSFRQPCAELDPLLEVLEREKREGERVAAAAELAVPLVSEKGGKEE